MLGLGIISVPCQDYVAGLGLAVSASIARAPVGCALLSSLFHCSDTPLSFPDRVHLRSVVLVPSVSLFLLPVSLPPYSLARLRRITFCWRAVRCFPSRLSQVSICSIFFPSVLLSLSLNIRRSSHRRVTRVLQRIITHHPQVVMLHTPQGLGIIFSRSARRGLVLGLAAVAPV